MQATTQCTNKGVVGPNGLPCKCPKRSPPPTDKPTLPCSPTEANLPILKEYILNRFKSSGFNTCSHQPLPLISTAPPLRLFVDPHATPVAISTPGTVPAHWAADVKAGLDRDERLGFTQISTSWFWSGTHFGKFWTSWFCSGTRKPFCFFPISQRPNYKCHLVFNLTGELATC